MPKVTIEEQGCRGCSMCFDVCPVDVFAYDEGKNLASVARQDDCIGCYSCFYVCPSQCVAVDDVPILRPFHRMEEHAALVEKFLQIKTASGTLNEKDCEDAFKDVSVRLMALAGAVTETMGRGQKAVGRKAGNVAAIHFPEMYEGKDLNAVLAIMQERFKHSFTFDYKLSGKDVELSFKPCGLCAVVENLSEKVGEAVLCHMFHEYWAGILGAFTGLKYQTEMGTVGKTCQMTLKGAESN